MPSENPYQSPLEQSQPEEWEEYDDRGSWWWVLCSFQGRISAPRFCRAMLAIIFFYCLPASIFWQAITMTGRPARPSNLLLLAVLMPAVWMLLAVQVKRWHDRNKSGWWVLINLAPVIGSLWMLIECGFFPGLRVDASLEREWR